MPQPGLMKVRRTFIDKNCLSSDVVSITFTYFLNPAVPKFEMPYSILPDQYPSKTLRGIRKLVFVSHLSPFEFFFHCKKQVKVTGARSGE
jgi:hypothetical protein